MRSYLQPAAILVSIPLGFAGAVLGHWVLGYALSFVSIFGVVALAGVAVNASVVLIDLYNQLREAGETPVEAAATASARRFRAVLLTTLTTALGLGPLLLETSPQAQFLIPMGVSLGFGILVSGLLVLFVTPAMAVVMDDLRGTAKRDADATGESSADARGPGGWKQQHPETARGNAFHKRSAALPHLHESVHDAQMRRNARPVGIGRRRRAAHHSYLRGVDSGPDRPHMQVGHAAVSILLDGRAMLVSAASDA